VVLGPDFKLQYWKKDTNNFQWLDLSLPSYIYYWVLCCCREWTFNFFCFGWFRSCWTLLKTVCWFCTMQLYRIHLSILTVFWWSCMCFTVLIFL
jgi:hypothetical protein